MHPPHTVHWRQNSWFLLPQRCSNPKSSPLSKNMTIYSVVQTPDPGVILDSFLFFLPSLPHQQVWLALLPKRVPVQPLLSISSARLSHHHFFTKCKVHYAIPWLWFLHGFHFHVMTPYQDCWGPTWSGSTLPLHHYVPATLSILGTHQPFSCHRPIALPGMFFI